MCQSDKVAVDSSKFLSSSCSSAYSLRLQLRVDSCTRFARLMVYNMSSVQDCATRGNPHAVLRAAPHMQFLTCFADALAFRGRSLVLRKARRIFLCS